IGENHLIAATADFVDRGIAVGRFVNRIAPSLERLAEHGSQLGLVFDKENGFHSPKGLARPAHVAAGFAQIVFGVGNGLLVGINLGLSFVDFSGFFVYIVARQLLLQLLVGIGVELSVQRA